MLDIHFKCIMYSFLVITELEIVCLNVSLAESCMNIVIHTLDYTSANNVLIKKKHLCGKQINAKSTKLIQENKVMQEEKKLQNIASSD